MRYLGVLRGRRSIPDPPGYERISTSQKTERTEEYDGERYQCRTVLHPAGRWSVSYGRNEQNDSSRIFVFLDDRLVYSRQCSRPIDADIAANGNVLLLEGGAFDRLDGRAIVFDAEGDKKFQQTFPINLRNCAISGSGTMAAVVTRPPSVTVYQVDVERGRVHSSHELEHGQIRLLGFAQDGGEQLLYVATDARDDPYFALDTDGDVVWQSERYRDSQPFSKRVREWIGSVNQA